MRKAAKLAEYVDTKTNIAIPNATDASLAPLVFGFDSSAGRPNARARAKQTALSRPNEEFGWNSFFDPLIGLILSIAHRKIIIIPKLPSRVSQTGGVKGLR